jgi:hypothetical protein
VAEGVADAEGSEPVPVVGMPTVVDPEGTETDGAVVPELAGTLPEEVGKGRSDPVGRLIVSVPVGRLIVSVPVGRLIVSVPVGRLIVSVPVGRLIVSDPVGRLVVDGDVIEADMEGSDSVGSEDPEAVGNEDPEVRIPVGMVAVGIMEPVASAKGAATRRALDTIA